MEEDSSEETNSEETSGKRRKARLRALLSQLPSTHSRFLPTARRIMQFAEGRVPGPDDKVVYMQGSWDIFNPGHIAALAAAKSLGSFVLVGIYDDPTINKLKGHGLPILNLYERTLSLLSCKFVAREDLLMLFTHTTSPLPPLFPIFQRLFPPKCPPRVKVPLLHPPYPFPPIRPDTWTKLSSVFRG